MDINLTLIGQSHFPETNLGPELGLVSPYQVFLGLAGELSLVSPNYGELRPGQILALDVARFWGFQLTNSPFERILGGEKRIGRRLYARES